MEDPYRPPSAGIEDRRPRRAVEERPIEVRRAVWLLWLSIPLSLVDTLLEIQRSPEAAMSFVAVVVGIFFAIACVLNVLVWRGVNWARIVVCALVALSLVMLPFDAGRLLESSTFELLLRLLVCGVDATAAWLLLTRPGALWFRHLPD